MRIRKIVLALAPLLLLPLAACGDSGDDQDAAGASTDEEYLAVFCKGLTEYQETLVTATTASAIADVIKAYIANLQGIQPPAGLKDYHSQYIGYLEDALRDPTSLVTRRPPLPPENDRQRLSAKAKDVAECKYPTFLDQPAQPRG